MPEQPDKGWTPPQVCIDICDESARETAAKISRRLALDTCHDDSSGWRLQCREKSMQLVRPDGVSVSIDFTGGKADRRSREPGFKKQPLARAIGLSALHRQLGRLPSVVDATAGLGQDGWMLVQMGCRVIMLEQSGVLHAMLEHALEQAGDSGNEDPLAVELVHTNAIEWLAASAPDAADVVYLDPMYPLRRKQAKVKKGMQLLHELVPAGGEPQNEQQLLHAAIAAATHRVVVKRPKGAPQLAGSDTFDRQVTNINSPNTRFDVYHIH